MGAGVIPFCVLEGKVFFLFHKTFSGRRAGHLVDFGGGGNEGESYRQTAMREFIEETETMFFATDLRVAIISPERIRSQMDLLEQLFDRTLNRHPDWWCRRSDSRRGKPRDWRTYFIEFDYRNPADMNRQWREDAGRRFKKRRELLWVASDELIEIYANAPHRLWRRVRQLEDAEKMIRTIADTRPG